MKKSNLLITIGDPAGCGPFISLRAIADSNIENFTVIGDAKILKRYSLFNKISYKINLIDLNTPNIEAVRPGYVSELTGQASFNYLTKAIELLKEDNQRALVTAPVSKEAISQVMPDFLGHTDLLAKAFAINIYAMLMEAGSWRVVLLTRHIPLIQVPKTLTKRLIKNNIALITHFLRRYHQIQKPKIVFSSFNPHAGVDTFLGPEEEMVAAAIQESGQSNIFGPYPADTIFLPQNIKRYHCLVALYHDQGMIPFKLLALKSGVNVTLGLPFIRTSPAHGVALDIMRNNQQPLHSSMLAAIKEAAKLSL